MCQLFKYTHFPIKKNNKNVFKNIRWWKQVHIQMELLQELKFAGVIMFVLWDNGMFDSPLLHPLNKHHQLMSVRWHTCDFVCIYVPWNIYLHPWCAFATKGLKTDRMGVCYQTFGFKTTLFLYKITCFSTTLLLLSFRADGLRTSFMICF